MLIACLVEVNPADFKCCGEGLNNEGKSASGKTSVCEKIIQGELDKKRFFLSDADNN